VTIEAMVEDYRKQLHVQGVPPGFGILAVSMGGMAAVHWAQKFPQEISRLVLVNTSMRPFSPVHHRLQLPALARLLWLILRRAGPQAWEEAIAVLTSGTASPATVSSWVALRLRQPVLPGNALRQLVAAARFQARQQPPDSPILLLGSRLDRLVSVQCSEAISLRWAVALLVHPSAGHDLTLDDGDWVSSAVQHWLATT
jgi:pimeloyl-ACP methyl ester carboxylesterase